MAQRFLSMHWHPTAVHFKVFNEGCILMADDGPRHDREKRERDEWKRSCFDTKKSRDGEDFTTLSGQDLEPLYTPVDLEGIDFPKEIGFPGQFPYTRGVQPTMYRGRLWTMRQYAGFGTAEESNKRYKFLIEKGQTGLSVAFDLPTQLGYDSDHEMSRGEVGRCGVAIDSIKDMALLFDGIDQEKVTTSMTINSPAAMLLAMYIGLAKKRGIEPKALGGTIQNDVLKEYVARGTYIFPPGPSLKIITDIFAYCSENIPRWNTISISGYHIREAGSTAVQEVAFTLANGIAYVQAAMDAGLDVDKFAPRLAFFFNSHLDFFEEVAKFRAARRLWAKIMVERFSAKNPRSLTLRFHTQTAGCSLTAQQPENNVVRVALQALAGVLGGTQSLHTNSMDEALALPTEKAVRIALHTQQIIAQESGVANTIDPVGGSYFIESLTSEIEAQALEYIEKIDKLGGMLTAIETGFVNKEIQDAAYRYQLQIEDGQKKVVGVNCYRSEDTGKIPLHRISLDVETKQQKAISDLKEKRDEGKVERCLDAVYKAAEGDENLMEPILEAVESYATLGEITSTLEQRYGRFRGFKFF